MDTGASDHMCHNKELFTTLLCLPKPIAATLPNGRKEFVTHSSTMRVTKDLILHGVLYVPSFRYNLLSVSRLSNPDGSYVIFTPKHYIM